MATIEVRHLGKDPFVFHVDHDTSTITTNLHCGYTPLDNALSCQKCSSSRASNRCHLFEALTPIVKYFSDIFSYDNVCVEYSLGDIKHSSRETGQRACLLLCIYAIVYSGCDFFQKFKPIFNTYKIDVNNDGFIRTMLAAALANRKFGLTDRPNYDELFKVKVMAKELQERIHHVLGFARSISNKDSVVNAVIILLALINFSEKELQEERHKFHAQSGGVSVQCHAQQDRRM